MPEPLDEDRVPPNQVLSHLGVMALVSAVLGVVVAGLAIPFAGLVGLAAKDLSITMRELPETLETRPLPQRTTILAKDGTPVAQLYDENRVNVPLTQVSKVMRQAILSIEDYRFYEHGALDLKGTMRAMLTNSAAGGVVQGGSSITQQMVKLTLLSQAKTKEEKAAALEETFARKIRELRYAIAFEENYSKDWILERYLNIAYFGDGVYGVQAAARHYFSTDARQLKLGQAATLAGLVKNPVGYDPTVYPSKAISRRNIVLDRMADLSVVPREKAQKAADKPLGLKITNNRNGCIDSRAPFFCDYVVAYLLNDPELGATRADRETLLKSGGLTIQTTLDLRFQQAADDAVRAHVYPTDNAIGGLAMAVPGTGEVRALAQSRPMGFNTRKGESMVNYTVSERFGGSRGFSPGSTFKAFVLAAAIRQGISLTTPISSPGQATYSESIFKTCGDETYGYGTWKVGNAPGIAPGTYNLYNGTQKSVNTFFAQLIARTGLCEPYRLARQMGVEMDNPRGERVPSFTLGVGDASPLEMAEAYATFAARGIHCDSRPVTELKDSNDNVVKEYAKQCTQVLPGAVADAVNDVLRGVYESGGYAARVAPPQPTAGKTGTAQDAKAVWLMGYTPNLSVAAMIAGANNAGQPIRLPGQTIGGSYISTASGSGFAGPMWGDAMRVIAQWLPDKDFPPPPPGEIAGFLLAVPGVGGMSVEAATKVLEGKGFEVTVAPGQVDSAYAQGTVAYTSPGGGTSASTGDTVTLYISDGTPYVKPPPKKKKKQPADDGDDGDGGGTGGGGGGDTGGGGGPGNGGGRNNDD